MKSRSELDIGAVFELVERALSGRLEWVTERVTIPGDIQVIVRTGWAGNYGIRYEFLLSPPRYKEASVIDALGGDVMRMIRYRDTYWRAASRSRNAGPTSDDRLAIEAMRDVFRRLADALSCAVAFARPTDDATAALRAASGN